MGFSGGAMVNYFLNYYVTFKSTKSHHEAMIKFSIVAVIGLILNTLMMALAIEVFALYYLLAQVISTGLVLFWNFIGNRLWTFWG
jgi:putative flippase GtrA